MYFQQPIFLMNIYAAPSEQVSMIIQIIKEEKLQTTYTNCVFSFISDFNIDIQLQTAHRKIFVQFMEMENL